MPLPIFFIQEILTFEQPIAYLDTYSEPEASKQCMILGFLLDMMRVEAIIEICTMQTVVRIVKDEFKREKDALKLERKRS